MRIALGLVVALALALAGCGASLVTARPRIVRARLPGLLLEDVAGAPEEAAVVDEARVTSCVELYERVAARLGTAEAGPALEAARAQVSGCVIADWLEAAIARERGDAEASFAALDRVALATDAEAVRADRIATALLMPGERGARRALLDCGPLPPVDAASRVGCAVAALRIGERRDAERWLVEALAIDALSFEAWADLGEMFLDHRGYDVARVALENATQLDPGDYEAWLARGAAERGLGDADAAEAAYRRAIALDPQRAEAFYDLGLLYESYRDGSEATHRQAQQFYREFVARAGSALAPQVDDVSRRCPVTWPRPSRATRRRSVSRCAPGRIQRMDDDAPFTLEVAEMQAEIAAMQAETQPQQAPSQPASPPAP